MGVYQRVKEEAERQCGTHRGWQQWMADQLTAVKKPGDPDYTTQRLQNWKYRGIPPGEHASIALALGKTVGWVAGVEAEDRQHPATDEPPAAATGVIEQLGALLSGASELTRASLAPLLERLARNPADAERIARTVYAVLAADAPAHEQDTAPGSLDDRPAPTPDPTPLAFHERRLVAPAPNPTIQYKRGVKVHVNPNHADPGPTPGDVTHPGRAHAHRGKTKK